MRRPVEKLKHSGLGNVTICKTDDKAQLTADQSVASVRKRNNTDYGTTAWAGIVTGCSIFLE